MCGQGDVHIRITEINNKARFLLKLPPHFYTVDSSHSAHNAKRRVAPAKLESLGRFIAHVVVTRALHLPRIESRTQTVYLRE